MSINMGYIGENKEHILQLISMLNNGKIDKLWITRMPQDELSYEGNIIIMSGYRSLLAESEIEYVIVENDYKERFDILSEALAFNKKSLSIAPFLYNIDQIDPLLLVSDAYQIPVMAGNEYEFKDGIISLAEMLMYNEAGEPEYIDMFVSGPAKDNAIFELTVHGLYVTNYILGKHATRVKAEADTFTDTMIEKIYTSLDYDQVKVSIETSINNEDHFEMGINVRCTNGMITYKMDKNGECLFANNENIELNRYNAFELMVNNFIKLNSQSDKSEYEANVESAVQVTRTACIIEESLQNNNIEITINEMTAKAREVQKQ